MNFSAFAAYRADVSSVCSDCTCSLLRPSLSHLAESRKNALKRTCQDTLADTKAEPESWG